MQRIAVHLLMSISFAGVASACGGDDAASPDVTTGLPAQEKLSEIPPSSVHSVCDAIEKSADEILPPAEIKRLGCTGGGLAVSTTLVDGKPAVDVAKCQEFFDRCQAGDTQGSESSVDLTQNFSTQTHCEDADVRAKLARCEATVGEFEACLTSTMSTIKTLFDALTCTAFENIEEATTKFQTTTPATLGPECTALETQCSGLFDDLRGAHDDASTDG